jgi:hypothetical protein
MNTRQLLGPSLALLILVACQAQTPLAPQPSDPRSNSASTPLTTGQSLPTVRATADPLPPPRSVAAVPPPIGAFSLLPTNPVSNTANSMILLTDGSVLVNNGDDWHRWSRLVPDSNGSYANGTWTSVASSFRGRLYYPEYVLPDGRVWVAGGEFVQASDNDLNQTEIYDPVANTWSAGPPGLLSEIADIASSMLNDGRIILGHRFSGMTQIYAPASNTFTTNATMLDGDIASEGNWQLLADGSVFAPTHVAQRYLPATDQWVHTAPAPIVVSSDLEQGPILMLQDGRVLVMSDRDTTAYFTPPTSAADPGSWTVGPSLPGGLFADDVPASILPDGKVLVEGTVGMFGDLSLFELDPNTSTYTSIASPFVSEKGFATRMLVLPTGQVMFSGGGAFWLYSPSGAPQDSWRPVISAVNPNADGSFTITGQQLNGRTLGAVYGDDGMMNSNFPIVYLKDAANHVYYLRSFGFSTMGIRTGSATVSAKFRVPASVPAGSYSLFVSAVGIASTNSVPFTVSGGGTTVTTTLGPVADAHVRGGTHAAENNGTLTTLEVKQSITTPGNIRRTFLKFDLGSITGTVTAAKLRLFGSHPTDSAALSAFAVSNNTWTETGITFNNQPALGGKQGQSVTVTTTAAYREWDVTSFVAAQKAGGINTASLALTMDAVNDNGPASFSSRENTANKPQLVVTATTGGGSNAAPTVAAAAFASPNPVNAMSTALSVLGADDGGEGNLTYTWSASGPAMVTFAGNNSNAAKNTSATFTRAGAYSFQVVIKDAGNLTATSSLTVTVNAVPTTVSVTPGTATVPINTTQGFTASASDQFGQLIGPTLVNFTWTVTGGGTISGAGVFTAGASAGGPFTLRATTTVGSVSGTSTINVTAGSSTTTFAATADAHVRDGGSATSNFGTAVLLQVKNSSFVGNSRRAFIRFSILGLTGTVASAKLRVFGNNTDGTNRDSCYAVTNSSWIENGITWSTQPALGTKQGASVAIGTVAKYYEFDVTAFIRAQKQANFTTANFAIAQDLANNVVFDNFNSHEATTNRPQLVVTTQ